eukprot:c18280_g1_i1.p1 GENE.c18280_g1_i1~~c18280_g1_i1.p1  ORF type:complete len:523 (-),score=134.99 c18280_g1_i1:125-1693(-)
MSDQDFEEQPAKRLKYTTQNTDPQENMNNVVPQKAQNDLNHLKKSEVVGNKENVPSKVLSNENHNHEEEDERTETTSSIQSDNDEGEEEEEEIDQNRNTGDRNSESEDDNESDFDDSASEDSVSSDEGDMLKNWFERVQNDKSVDPKHLLQQQGILTDKKQLEFISDEFAWKLLKVSINMLARHLKTQQKPPPRQRLKEFCTLDHVINLIRDSNKIMVLTGAGISVSCGIPDFRSENGLYKIVEKRFQLPDPQAIFDINYFVSNPIPFFQFAKELYPGNFKPSLSHYFIKCLEDKSKLLRNYTQNIDTLEQVAGIEKCLECHGSFRTATCFNCKHRVGCEDIRESIMQQKTPNCSQCTGPFNVLKPDIVFFGEGLPPTFGPQLMEDRKHVDLLLVMGSSLRVRPVCTIPTLLESHVPQILINRECVGQPHEFDIVLLGNCDEIISYLCYKIGWNFSNPSVPLIENVKEPKFIPPNIYLFEGGVSPIPPEPQSTTIHSPVTETQQTVNSSLNLSLQEGQKTDV